MPVSSQEITTKKILAELKRREKEMARLRDSLRDLSDQIEDESDRVKDAHESLEYCIQRLSETV